MPEQARSADAWPALPAEVAELLRPQLDRAVTEMISKIQSEVPEYKRPTDALYTDAVRRAVRHSAEQFVERVAHPDGSSDAIVAEFRGIGAVEAREGRSLEPLQNALRLGARVAWRRLCEAAAERRLDMEVLGRIGEAIFVYLDELAAACAAGYQEKLAQVSGEQDRRRRRLLGLIITDPPASPEEVADRARAAGWPLPRRVALVALEVRDDGPAGWPLPPDVLADREGAEPCLLLPDPDGPGRRALLERALDGWPAALGPSVPLARAAASLRWARRALALGGRGVLGNGHGVIRCDEHMATLLIFSDEELLRGLCAARLAPLERLRPAQRDRLAETLLAWLAHGANANEVAALVHVHPQTVRYRLRQIDELFGDVLHEPDARFELEIALRGRRFLEATAPSPGPPDVPAP